MKNLYPKGKGKIHPSPASPSVGGGGGGSAEVSAVLKLLPAAILALTAVLGSDDREVLAYLITWSINGPAAVVAAGEERRRCRRLPGGVHRAVFDCECFDCYTGYWSRWDCSPNRELIHQAIEAFEEHLASAERSAGGRGRRRERNRSEKGKKGKDKEVKRAEGAEEKVGEVLAAGTAFDSGESCSVEEKGAEEAVEVKGEEGWGDEREPEEEMDMSGIEPQQQQQPATAMGGERRRGWPDVMGLFNSRLWSLWSPGV